MLDEAMTAYRDGDFRECLAQLAPWLAQDAAPPPVLLLAAQAYVKLGDMEPAADLYLEAARRAPEKHRLLVHLAARILMRASRAARALDLAREAVAAGSFDVEVMNTYRQLLRFQLRIDEVEAEDAALLAMMREGRAEAFAIDDPHDHIMWCDDEALNARLTRMHGGVAFTAEQQARRRALPHRFGERIRIGYLSNDFSDQHATMRLFQGVLLHHDPSCFDVTLFCYTPADLKSIDTGSRARYGRIVDIGGFDDGTARAAIRAAGIDILVDLKGHTRDARISLVNSGLAPVQVAFLGFPGTGTGIDCDYVIGDAIVSPPSSQPFFHERICRLPECYQPNDNRLRPLPPATARADLGLPETAFIIASFNAIKKISPLTARLWARVLNEVPDAVLWMMCSDTDARGNFADHMRRLGVAPERLFFTGMASYAAHIARVQAADIAIDTFPTNGHTTTSDMLWAGLPVVSKRGRNFTSRVSESLLNAIGLPQLVAASDDGFVELCRDLAGDRDRLAGLRRHLAINRGHAPLFDTARYTRHLETAYTWMIERAKAGLPPAPIDVPALPRDRSERS